MATIHDQLFVRVVVILLLERFCSIEPGVRGPVTRLGWTYGLGGNAIGYPDGQLGKWIRGECLDLADYDVSVRRRAERTRLYAVEAV